MRPNASRRIRVEAGVASERLLASEDVLAQSAEEAGLDLSSWTIRIMQGDRIWGTVMKTAKGARRVPYQRRIHFACPHFRKRARSGAYGRGGWRSRPQDAGNRTGENAIIEAPEMGLGSRLH